ncbi:hypothetical protein N7449_000944 [Penicillium cf. viridicatum]|uniref:FAD-dependent oxidoreductase 2 FAD-binding domain-containing protein n=1 Tax=Penicillium cf. viridicatum TaxID=2972119 RepID=A0A9W9N5U9_9EURO|nr:hypothetical protein N7449_000944 [Penicillium cf. viridicatum]
MKTIEVDVLVCGGGMSGLACAAFAAEAGAKVLVVEKQADVGGSSNYSAGMFWAPQTYNKLRSWVPEGDPVLQKAWLSDYLPAVQWMRENGVPTADRFDGIMTIGIGFPIKIPHLHNLHRKRIQSSKTHSDIFTNTSVELPRFANYILRSQSQSGSFGYGGFQGSPGMTSKYLGQGGDNIFVRSNRGSVGDGLKLAIESGAGTSRGMNTYYGHLLAAPLRAEDVDPKDYLPLAQYRQRFADETTGDEIINQYLAKQPKRRGFILFNEKTRLEHCVTALFPNAGDIDRLQKAREHGCNVRSASTLDGLMDILHGWGVNYVQARRTIEEYDRVVRLGDKGISLDAPIGRACLTPTPLVDGEGPFYAMEVQPSITFTYGGVAIDAKGHALTPDKSRIPGLLVAGVDAGGFSNLGYAGGLALAFVTGLWAAREVASDLGLPEPRLPPADIRDGEDKPIQGRL